jgi:hypothetical protein
MPLDLEIIRASEFVRVGASGQLDFEASKRALQLIAAACRKRGIDRAILDLRSLPIPGKPIFTRRDLAALVETFHEAGFEQEQRLVVLYRDDPHHGVRKFAFIGTMQGWQVRAFSDFEKALLWLSQENPSENEPDEPSIPVRRIGKKVPVKSEPESGTASADPAS